jgi:transaldolase/glucose-6-phosphate isomerase
MTSSLKILADSGQGVWLDFVERGFLKAGGLEKLIAADGLSGVTSNPSIFEHAIGHGANYDAAIAAFLGDDDAAVGDIYDDLSIGDITTAADQLRVVYDRLDRRDGYVSLEVSPYLADMTQATIAEALRLWGRVDRPNVMIKVPGTPAGIPAIRTLIEHGLNINVTLLFSIPAYIAVAEAFMTGLEARVAAGLPIDGIASVASFFLSRIDVRIDHAIAGLHAGDDPAKWDAHAVEATALDGKIAIASAKMAYAWYGDMIAGARWQALAARGAMPQRLLWASTGTKNPAYSDILYVESLIGPETVNTMPPQTMDAFRDHGQVAETLAADPAQASAQLAEAEDCGLDLAGVTEALVTDGVEQFSAAADALLAVVAGKRAALLGDRLNGFASELPAGLHQAVTLTMDLARLEGWVRRCWRGDAGLWTGKDEARWLGWLDAAKGLQVDCAALDALAADARGYADAVLLGMGGSSLGPEVLARMFASPAGFPRLHVLDTSDPAQIGRVAAAIDPARTLFIVSSKSGSTLEPEILRAYFHALVAAAVGADQAGRQFVAVTDPGSDLDKMARSHGFAHIFNGDPAIGGRYSVLSVFGMVPAAIIGIDVRALYAATRAMVLSCGPDVPPLANPGVQLGIILGEAVRAGRDKVTILTTPGLAPLGPWLEQLLAESTGKQGTGIVPVDGEPIGDPAVYGADRLFVHLQSGDESDAAQEAALAALVAAGQPLVRITVAHAGLVGQEFFRWEIATAIAAVVIGIDPFDQPDVETSKIATRTMVDAYEASGKLVIAAPIHADAQIALYAPDDQHGGSTDPDAVLAGFFGRLGAGDYAGILAYIERDAAHEAELTRLRVAIRQARHTATVAEFGPRFLHSTGQAYKGGPATGHFLVITRDPPADIAIPARKASFGTVELAQALGDMDVLVARGRRVLRIHLRQPGPQALADLVSRIVALLEKDAQA